MTSGASTAGSTSPTDANICCRNIAARAINIRDKLILWRKQVIHPEEL
jgi:hypothetical protein